MTTRYTAETAFRWRPATHPRRVNTPLDGTNRCRSIRGISRHTEIVGPGDSEREWPMIVIVGRFFVAKWHERSNTESVLELFGGCSYRIYFDFFFSLFYFIL